MADAKENMKDLLFHSVTERPSLWFHLDRILPKASDQSVPPIHYHQMVNPVLFVMPDY